MYGYIRNAQKLPTLRFKYRHVFHMCVICFSGKTCTCLTFLVNICMNKSDCAPRHCFIGLPTQSTTCEKTKVIKNRGWH